MKNILFLLFIILFSFTSCEKDINLDIPKQDPRIAVHGIWERNDPLEITVTRSFNITQTPSFDYMNDPPTMENRLKKYSINNAKVLVYRNNVVYDELVFDNQTFIYKSPTGKTAVPGYNYNVEVTAPGFTGVQSPVLTYPDKVPIKSMELRLDASRDEGGNKLHELVVEFDDPAAIKNFYWLKVERQYGSGSGSTGSTYYSPMDIYPVDKDIIVPSASDISTFLPRVDSDKILLKDDNFNGQTKKLVVRISSWMYDPTNASVKLTVTLMNANEDVFKYLRSRLLDVDNPFSTPVQAYSNISQGLGIFGLYAGDKKIVQ